MPLVDSAYFWTDEDTHVQMTMTLELRTPPAARTGMLGRAKNLWVRLRQCVPCSVGMRVHAQWWAEFVFVFLHGPRRA